MLTPEQTQEFYSRRVQQHVRIFRRVAGIGAVVILNLSWLEFVFSRPDVPSALLFRLVLAILVAWHLRHIPTENDDRGHDIYVMRHTLLIVAISCYIWARVPQLYHFALPAHSQIILLSSLALARSSRVPWLLIPCIAVEVALWCVGQSPRALFFHSLSMLFGLGLAGYVANWLEESQLHSFRLEKQLEKEATTDPLTQAFNRRALNRLADEEITRSRRYDRPCRAVILDIDYFKKINDTHGHDVGDQAICSVARACQETVRTTDRVGRWGGEEFVVLLPETNLSDALVTAERLRARVEALPIPTARGPVRITLSCGVSELAGTEAFEDLVKRADEALYRAKQEGRNRVQAC